MNKKQISDFSSLSKNKKILTIINYTLCLLFSLTLICFITLILIYGDPTNRLVACISNLICYLLPFFIQWVFKTRIAPGLLLIYIIFLTIAGFMGSCLLFNRLFLPFDKIQHFSWGYLSCFIGIYLLCKSKDIDNVKTSTIILFFIGISLATASIWEIIEFTGDTLLGQTAQGKPDINMSKITDTMLDIIFHTLGTIIFTIHFSIDKFTKKNLGITYLINDFKSNY